jgi:serine protease inhibitor
VQPYAAATAAVMVTRSMPAPPMMVVLDRPFLFFVEDAKSGALLFAGVGRCTLTPPDP